MQQLLAGKEASPGGDVHQYERHRPEKTLLYRLVEQHYPGLAEQMAAQGRPTSPAVDQRPLRKVWKQKVLAVQDSNRKGQEMAEVGSLLLLTRNKLPDCWMSNYPELGRSGN